MRRGFYAGGILMIIEKLVTTTGNVVTATVNVSVDPVELAQITAYGEPQVDTYGTFPYVPTVPVPDGDTPLTANGDLGAPAVAGSAVVNAGTGALEVTSSGALPVDLLTNPGFYRRAPEVIGDWQLQTRLDIVLDTLNTTGFINGLAAFTANGDAAPGIILGWGALNAGASGILVLTRTIQGNALVQQAFVARASSRGITLRMRRSADSIVCSYSLDDGVTFATLYTMLMTQQAIQVGLFANSGQATASLSVHTGLGLDMLPLTAPNTFTLYGGPRLRAIRSGAPHTMTMSRSVDLDAEAKMTGWASEMSTRIITARNALMALTVPTSTPSVVRV